MAPAKPPNDEEIKNNTKQQPNPRRASAANNTSPAAKRPGNNGVATPANNKVSTGQTPKSAPAATGTGATRKTAPKKTIEPTLLGDFLLGRPSPARQAAARRKSLDAAAVKQEVRQQMRQDAVRKVPRPGGVQNRVKAWQKANAAAMANGNPEDAASEPTEVAVHIDAESVTEEDRVRIKFRQKPRRKSDIPKASPTKDNGKEVKQETVLVNSPTPTPPKKRIVSDDNWMKRNRANTTPKATGPSAKPSPTPQKMGKPSPMQNKIQSWAMKVELPEDPAPPKIPKNPRPTKEYNTKCGATITVEESASNISGSEKTGPARDYITVEEDASSSSSTWQTQSGLSGDDGIRVRPMKGPTPQSGGNGVLHIKPTMKKEPQLVDDGIRVRPIKASLLPDDGIRVRPMDDTKTSRITSRSDPARVTSAERERTPTGRSEVSDESETEVGTPTTRRSRSRVSARRTRRATAPAPTVTETSITQSDDDQTWTSDHSGSHNDSDKPSTAPTNSLAEIPFGYSAFSELDLPVGADHHHIKRPKPQRNSSFTVVPKAFKKIVTGAKEIVQEQVHPPKPVVNQPPSIENWLNDTVDPFVDKSTAKRKSVDKARENNARRRSSVDAGHNPEPVAASPPGQVQDIHGEDNKIPKGIQRTATEPALQPSPGLKRSKATRGNPAPSKQTAGKIPLREALNNLFRGESSGHKISAKAYSSYQDMGPDSEPSELSDLSDLSEDDRTYQDYVEDNDKGDPHVRSVDPERRSTSPESSYFSTDVSSSTHGPYMTSAIPRNRPPPTHGHHELSTIFSEESASTLGSDTMSLLSESTVTQTTALTRSTAISRRNKRPGPKRRLTKHSDLVSVLSLPDSEDGLARAKSIKLTSSLRRKTSNLEKVNLEDLLKEFMVDEDLYQRELKTLVDGAVPVLLRKVVHEADEYVTDLFGNSAGETADTMGKAVVNMGIALEKLKALHKRAPVHDVNKILTWIQTAYPIYDTYLDVWRLGFEGVIVNLAPALERLDYEDSLVNAMPLNEDGDVVDTKGEPVDLQRLLTRPLARIRGLLKLLKVCHQQRL